MDQVQHHEDAEGGEFFVERDGERAGEMTYTRDGDGRVTIRHTEVGPRFEGQGLGRTLVDAAVQWARTKRIKIEPVCSYARSVFDKTPAYHDVRA